MQHILMGILVISNSKHNKIKLSICLHNDLCLPFQRMSWLFASTLVVLCSLIYKSLQFLISQNDDRFRSSLSKSVIIAKLSAEHSSANQRGNDCRGDILFSSYNIMLLLINSVAAGMKNSDCVSFRPFICVFKV